MVIGKKNDLLRPDHTSSSVLDSARSAPYSYRLDAYRRGEMKR